MSDKRRCEIDGCDLVHHSRGMCHNHYESARRRKALPPLVVPTSEERFWAKVDKTSTCWIWIGARTGAGYGNFSNPGRINEAAHRVAWRLMDMPPIPEGLVLDHLCRVRACVNPAHLEPVTQLTNLMRGIGPQLTVARAKEQTHCKHGHPLFGSNLAIDNRGGRRCRECARISGAKYRAKPEAKARHAAYERARRKKKREAAASEGQRILEHGGAA